MASIYNFIKKEGKFFAPIVNEVDSFGLDDSGQVVANGTRLESGAKGVYARVRLETDATGKAELFAVNTEMFPSSN